MESKLAFLGMSTCDLVCDWLVMTSAFVTSQSNCFTGHQLILGAATTLFLTEATFFVAPSQNSIKVTKILQILLILSQVSFG
jgi:hypothetical protein